MKNLFVFLFACCVQAVPAQNATWRFGVSGANLCSWLLYMISSQTMSGPWCVWGISTIFSSVGMSLGSAKYDTYAL